MTDESRAKLLEAARQIGHAMRFEIEDDMAQRLREIEAELRELAAVRKSKRVEYRAMGSMA